MCLKGEMRSHCKLECALNVSLWSMLFILRAEGDLEDFWSPSMVRPDKCHDFGKLIALDRIGNGCRQYKRLYSWFLHVSYS